MGINIDLWSYRFSRVGPLKHRQSFFDFRGVSVFTRNIANEIKVIYIAYTWLGIMFVWQPVISKTTISSSLKKAAKESQSKNITIGNNRDQ